MWTISPPLAHDVQLAGSGKATVDVTTRCRDANLVLDVYDLDANGTGPLITRQGHLVRSQRPGQPRPVVGGLEVKAGHRIARQASTDSNADWWVHVPTKQTVTVGGGSISLPFLPPARATGTIQGDPGTQLESYLADTVTVPAETISTAETESFATP